MDKTRKKIEQIPKTEIHLHIEGLASIDTIWALKKKNKIDFPNIKTKEDLRKAFQISSLNEFLDLFINVFQASFKTEEDIEYLIKDAEDYLKRNNIFYTEMFFAVTKFMQMGLSYEKIATILDEGAKRIYQSANITVKYLIDVSRGFGPENAMKNLDSVITHKKPSIIGIGLGGAETTGPASDYKKVFEKAQKSGLKTVAHAGEVVGPQSIWDALTKLNSQRIGHGISAVQDKELLNHLKETKTPLEVCPTSNFFTQTYCKDYTDHPIRLLYDAGVYVTVNSDDPTFFGVELNEEYARLVDNKIFTLEEVVGLIKNNLYATFLSKEVKDQIWDNIQKGLN